MKTVLIVFLNLHALLSSKSRWNLGMNLYLHVLPYLVGVCCEGSGKIVQT